jgi:hypothetical protein
VVDVPSIYRRLACLGVAGIVLVLFVGHVCVAASAADTPGTPLGQPHHAASHHDDAGNGAEGAHAVLCDGMVAKTGTGAASVVLPAVASISFAFTGVPVITPSARSRESRSRTDASPPPLFLLHASLLI